MGRDAPWRLLFTWATWVRLRHPTTRWLNWYATPALALLCTAVTSIPGVAVNFTQEFGIAHQINGLLQILAPFFIGALAAISSFQRDALDEPMSANPPTLLISGETHIPSRREFFGYLFGYLAALSVVVYALGALGMVLGSSPSLKPYFDVVRGSTPAVIALRFAYAMGVVNLALTTFIGLHFLVYYLPKKPARAGMELLPGIKPPPPTDEDGVLRVGAGVIRKPKR
jgi:hypothetical protein